MSSKVYSYRLKRETEEYLRNRIIKVGEEYYSDCYTEIGSRIYIDWGHMYMFIGKQCNSEAENHFDKLCVELVVV